MIINIAHAGRITEATPIATVLLNTLNFLLASVGVVAIIALVINGIIYFTAQGDYQQIEKAKRMTVYSIIGIIIALASLLVVRQVIKLLGGR